LAIPGNNRFVTGDPLASTPVLCLNFNTWSANFPCDV